MKISYMEVVSFTLEFSWGVNLISHDSGDSFFNILHPLDHFGLAHKVDILNKRVIFLPKCHVEIMTTCWLEGSILSAAWLGWLILLKSLQKKKGRWKKANSVSDKGSLWYHIVMVLQAFVTCEYCTCKQIVPALVFFLVLDKWHLTLDHLF